MKATQALIGIVSDLHGEGLLEEGAFLWEDHDGTFGVNGESFDDWITRLQDESLQEMNNV